MNPDVRRWALIGVILAVEVAAALVLSQSLAGAIAIAAAVAGLLLLVLAGSEAWLALVVAAQFLSLRIGFDALDMSVADVTLVAGALIAAFKVDVRPRRVRAVLLVASVYLGMLAVNVFVHTSRLSVLEWLHRVALLVGALLVGIAIAQAHRVTFALRVTFITAAVFAGAAITTWVSTGFTNAYPFGFGKNFVGPMLAMTALLVQTCRRRADLSQAAAVALWAFLALGLVATNSRGAMLALAAAMVVVAARDRRGRLRLLLLAPVIVGFVVYTGISIRDSTTGANDTQFNTVNSRLASYEVALDRFDAQPWFGAGLRWFKEPGAYAGEPHNAIVHTLSETGVWGAFATLVLFGGALVIAWRLPGRLGAAAVALLVFRFAQGQFDIFWLAGTMTLPWIVLGMAAGDDRVDDEPDPVVDEHLHPRLVGRR